VEDCKQKVMEKRIRPGQEGPRDTESSLNLAPGPVVEWEKGGGGEKLKDARQTPCSEVT